MTMARERDTALIIPSVISTHTFTRTRRGRAGDPTRQFDLVRRLSISLEASGPRFCRNSFTWTPFAQQGTGPREEIRAQEAAKNRWPSNRTAREIWLQISGEKLPSCIQGSALEFTQVEECSRNLSPHRSHSLDADPEKLRILTHGPTPRKATEATIRDHIVVISPPRRCGRQIDCYFRLTDNAGY